jgi:hypothetical protein
MTDTPIERLKGCPFCGRQPILISRVGASGYRCSGKEPSHFVHSYGATDAEAAITWNTRSTIDPIPSAGEGERIEARANANSLKAAFQAVQKIESPFDPHRQTPENCAFNDALDAAEQAIRALTTLPSEPLPASQEEIEGRAREMLEVARFLRLTADVWTKGGHIDLASEPIVCNRHAETLERIAGVREEGRS